MSNEKAKDPLVAAETILIEGRAFKRGEAIEKVSKGELERAISARRVIRKSELAALARPAPILGAPQAPALEDSE